MSHAALFRNDRGGLEVRHYPTAAAAAQVAADRELPAPACAEPSAGRPAANERMLDHKTFAKRLGVPSQLLRAMVRRGALPGAVTHSARLVHIPARFMLLARIHGLVGLERMAKSGRL